MAKRCFSPRMQRHPPATAAETLMGSPRGFVPTIASEVDETSFKVSSSAPHGAGERDEGGLDSRTV